MEMILPRLGVVRVAIKMPPGRLICGFFSSAGRSTCPIMTASLSHQRDGVTTSYHSDSGLSRPEAHVRLTQGHRVELATGEVDPPSVRNFRIPDTIHSPNALPGSSTEQQDLRVRRISRDHA